MTIRGAVLLGLGLASVAAGPIASTHGIHDRTIETFRMGPITRARVAVTVGGVTLTAWDRPDIVVEVERRASTAKALTDLPIAIAHEGDTLSVSVTQRHEQRSTDLHGSVTIRAPSRLRFDSIDVFEGSIAASGFGGGLRAKVERGTIAASLVGGALHLETVIGEIRVAHEAPTVTAPLWVRSFNGLITLRLLARPRHLRILALSLGGQVISDIPLTVRTGFGPRFGEATFGVGEPLVSIDTVNGDIRIEAAR